MAGRGQVFKCSEHEMLVEVLHGGSGELQVNGRAMQQMVENTVDAAQEKHVPVIQRTSHGITVHVGSVAHPMQEEHYIEWIELASEDMVCRKYLKPGDPPEASFPDIGENVTAREYCNLHGLWKA